MLKFNKELLKNKTIEELDERFFKLNDNDEIELTDFAENKIAKKMKDFYGNKLKELSIQSNDFRYISKSENKKEKINEKETEKLKEEYLEKYPEINEEYISMQEKYKDSHSDEFEWVEIIDPAVSIDDEGVYVSSGGTLKDLVCTNIQEAAIGYQTASQFLKDNPDTSNFPAIKQYKAKDRNLWNNAKIKMREELFKKYTNVPKDIFNPKVLTEDYSYTIKWREIQKLTSDNSLLHDVVNEYIKTMIE